MHSETKLSIRMEGPISPPSAYRIEKLAMDIKAAVPDEPLVCLCVLKGGYKFFTDLVDRLKSINTMQKVDPVPLKVDFIRLKSYVVRSASPWNV